MQDIIQHFVSSWGLIVIDRTGIVRQAGSIPGQGGITPGNPIQDQLPWFQLEWLDHQSSSRIVEGSQYYRFLLEIFPESNGDYYLFFRSVKDYRLVEHLRCEITDEIISIQKFIDTFYDGVFISDERGNVLVVNDSWSQISGIAKEEVLGRTLQYMVDYGLIPHSSTLQAIEKKGQVSTVINYPRGKTAFVTSTPLYNKQGKVIRILSNVRDLSELNNLQKELQEVTTLSEGLQRELKAFQAMDKNPNLKLARSITMENLYAMVTKVANTDLQLLITGSSGVGKTALAKFVHSISERSNSGSFIHVNCSAIPDSLLESELFGYEPGAFTGAGKGKVGLFDLADRGTLFLDEIGDMPLSLQSKILNVLQEKCFYRVGGRKPIQVDVRIIAATNVNLEEYIESGKFREDLYYRLNVVPVNIPRLADRREDILPLISYYLECCNKRHQKSKIFSPAVIDAFIKYDWPGNIREIINLIERLVVTVDEPVIAIQHLPKTIKQLPIPEVEKAGLWKPDVSLKEIIKELEEKVIEEALLSCDSYKEAAQRLDIDVATLFRKRQRNQKSAKNRKKPSK